MPTLQQRRLLLSGGAPIFSPLALPGLLLDLNPALGMFSDAGTTPAVNNDPVQQANEQSGAGIILSQGTLANRPLLITAGPNGKPVLRFDGVNDALFVVLPVAIQIDNYTYLVVGSRSAAASAQSFMQAGDIAVSHQSFRTDTAQKLNPQSWAGGAADSFVGGTALGTTTHVLTVRRSSADNALTGFIDGTLTGTDAALGAATAAYGTAKVLTVGAEGSGSVRWLAGDIARLLIYNHALTTGERQTAERGLGTLYAVTVA